MRIVSSLLLLALAGCAAGPSTTIQPAAGEVRIARSFVTDFTSKINQRAYRVTVALPNGVAPGMRYPTLYVLDGNQHFGSATDIVNRQSHSKLARPAIVVGIGYQTDDYATINVARELDLTPSLSTNPARVGVFGGARAFSRVLEEEIKPMVAARFPTDPAQQILWGHSYAGLFALRTMLLNPGAYSTYILSSPSIWWNNREVLADEADFARRARLDEFKLRVLVTSAGDEQYRGSDPALLAKDNAQVDNASALAQRLGQINPRAITVQRVIFDGEVHLSVTSASLNRGVRFALPLDEAAKPK